MPVFSDHENGGRGLQKPATATSHASNRSMSTPSLSLSSMSGQSARSKQEGIDDAIRRLRSLHDWEAGYAEVVGFGPDVVPALRSLLFERERSGLSQARCHAVEALAVLGAFDVLAEFLRSTRATTDPVERLGEDVVVSTAARSIARLREDWIYHLLVDCAAHRTLPGVLVGLGLFRRRETIPIFIDALSEDEVRLTSEAILREFGKAARPALVAAAVDLGGHNQMRSESRLRKRRSAMTVLLDIGIRKRDWPDLRSLMDDDDPHIALLACRACLQIGTESDFSRVASRLVDLRGAVGWFDRECIDEILRDLKVDDSTSRTAKSS